MTDLEVPPLASHIATKQARSFKCALCGGDLDARETIVCSAMHKLEEFLPVR